MTYDTKHACRELWGEYTPSRRAQLYTLFKRTGMVRTARPDWTEDEIDTIRSVMQPRPGRPSKDCV